MVTSSQFDADGNFTGTPAITMTASLHTGGALPGTAGVGCHPANETAFDCTANLVPGPSESDGVQPSLGAHLQHHFRRRGGFGSDADGDVQGLDKNRNPYSLKGGGKNANSGPLVIALS
jgi:hypothetical protein